MESNERAVLFNNPKLTQLVELGPILFQVIPVEELLPNLVEEYKYRQIILRSYLLFWVRDMSKLIATI